MTCVLNFPIPAERLVPHRPPMLLIDRLTWYEEGNGVVEACIPPDGLLVDKDGYIESSVMIELIAQSCAAVRGYEDLHDEKPMAKGFLVGISNLTIHEKTQAGKTLRIEVKNPTNVGDFAIVEGEIFCHGQCVALGTIKLWITSDLDAPQ